MPEETALLRSVSFKLNHRRSGIAPESETEMIVISFHSGQRSGHVVIHAHDNLIEPDPVSFPDPAIQQLAFQVIRTSADEFFCEIV